LSQASKEGGFWKREKIGAKRKTVLLKTNWKGKKGRGGGGPYRGFTSASPLKKKMGETRTYCLIIEGRLVIEKGDYSSLLLGAQHGQDELGKRGALKSSLRQTSRGARDNPKKLAPGGRGRKEEGLSRASTWVTERRFMRTHIWWVRT